MSKQKRTYLHPQVTVCEIELESAICGGSVIAPVTEQAIKIESQGFATDGEWAGKGDFSNVENWTPGSEN